MGSKRMTQNELKEKLTRKPKKILRRRPTVFELVNNALEQSLTNLRKRISNVRYGQLGTILFDFDGVPYFVPEPKDVMPVLGSDLAQKKWAVRQILDKTAKKVEPKRIPRRGFR